jgi:polyhydroxyalkanoate synthesis regulator phasin
MILFVFIFSISLSQTPKVMKTKTILELLTLSSSIYYLAKDTKFLDKISEFSEKGKENLNNIMSESHLDENGNELEFADKIILKTHELKEELNDEIEELIVKFYKKINVAHLDEIKALNEKLDKMDATVALLEARLNRIEA